MIYNWKLKPCCDTAGENHGVTNIIVIDLVLTLNTYSLFHVEMLLVFYSTVCFHHYKCKIVALEEKSGYPRTHWDSFTGNHDCAKFHENPSRIQITRMAWLWLTSSSPEPHHQSAAWECVCLCKWTRQDWKSEIKFKQCLHAPPHHKWEQLSLPPYSFTPFLPHTHTETCEKRSLKQRKLSKEKKKRGETEASQTIGHCALLLRVRRRKTDRKKKFSNPAGLELSWAFICESVCCKQ